MLISKLLLSTLLCILLISPAYSTDLTSELITPKGDKLKGTLTQNCISDDKTTMHYCYLEYTLGCTEEIISKSVGRYYGDFYYIRATKTLVYNVYSVDPDTVFTSTRYINSE